MPTTSDTLEFSGSMHAKQHRDAGIYCTTTHYSACDAKGVYWSSCNHRNLSTFLHRSAAGLEAETGGTPLWRLYSPKPRVPCRRHHHSCPAQQRSPRGKAPTYPARTPIVKPSGNATRTAGYWRWGGYEETAVRWAYPGRSRNAPRCPPVIRPRQCQAMLTSSQGRTVTSLFAGPGVSWVASTTPASRRPDRS